MKVDSVVVINLEKRVDRLTKLLESNNLPKQTRFFPAIQAVDGCGRSHLACIDAAGPNEDLLVLEDDVVLTDGWLTEANKMLRYAPTGRYYPFGALILNETTTDADVLLFGASYIEKGACEPVNRHWFSVKHFSGTHAVFYPARSHGVVAREAAFYSKRTDLTDIWDHRLGKLAEESTLKVSLPRERLFAASRKRYSMNTNNPQGLLLLPLCASTHAGRVV